jgi:acyl carrier protein phosphodiesterase
VLAGALLGDYWRGALPPEMPPDLALSVRLHRRIDAVTDRHPQVQAARAGFADGERRYAGILLDLLYDHLLAQDWARYSAEALPDFARRAARHVVSEARWFEQAGGPVPQAGSFGALLVSYGSEAGLEQAVRRTAQRLRKPQVLLDAMRGWRGRLPRLREDLPVLLEDLRKAASSFTAC